MSARININDAVKLATIMARIKAQIKAGGPNYGRSGEFCDEIARLRLPQEDVQPLLDEINRRNGFNANKSYRHTAVFFPPKSVAVSASQAALEAEQGDEPCTFQGVDLHYALHGPLVPYNDRDRVGSRRIGPFPYAQAFAKLKIADQTTSDDTGAGVGIWIMPWHDHEPGDRCCYAIDCNEEDTEYFLGCRNSEIPQSWIALKYLESGLITLDDFRPFMYTPEPEESDVAAPELPDGIYPDDAQGLYVLDGLEPVRICNTVYPVAHVVDENGIPRGRQVRFWDGKGWQLHTIAARLLESEGAALFQNLTDNGLPINNAPLARAAFRDIVKAPALTRTVTQYSRPGWHAHRFVLPTGYSLSATEPSPSRVLVAREAATLDQTQGGTFEAWREGVADEIWKGDTPQFAIGQLAGMAGVITNLLKVDHPVVHFSGPPASGKSTAQIIAAGLTANPEPQQGTLVELQEDVEAALPKGYGTCAHIDDPTKHGSPTKVEQLMYRALRLCPFTVSSVASLEQIVERAGGRMDEGIRRRVLTVDTRKLSRINPRRADAIKQAAQENYGHAAPRFIAEIINKGWHTERKAMREVMDAMMGGLPGDMNDPETYEAAKHIAVLRVVGVVMHGAGLLPDGADTGATLDGIWRDWLARRTATPVNRAIAALDTALSDAPALGSDPEAPAWTADGVGYVPTDRVEEIVGSEIRPTLVMRRLEELGRLIVPAGRNLAWPFLPGGSARLQRQHYRIRLAA
jgi:hypothetical protein